VAAVQELMPLERQAQVALVVAVLVERQAETILAITAQ
jgi:hypothetical protein